MIIIFEGADQSGKTTIAKELAKQIDYQYFKHSQQITKFFEEDRSFQYIEANFFLDFLFQIQLHLVIDRHIPSEFAYALAYKRNIDIKQILEIDKKFAVLGSILIYCEKQEYINFSDTVVSKEKHQAVINYYQEYLELTQMKYLRLDTTDENLDHQITQIQNFLKENK